MGNRFKNVATQEGITFSISGVKERVIVYSFALLVGGTSVANIIIPNRPDPFTGKDGAKLGDRIDVLELEVSSCRQRNSTHKEQQASELATIKAKTLSNEYLIKQCMRITGQ